MRLWLTAALLTVATAVGIGSAPPALACSCVTPSASMVRGGDAAFVGRWMSGEFLDAEPAGEGEAAVPAGRPMRHEFLVERVVHGSLPERVEVEATSDGASCGLGEQPGQGSPIGLVLNRQADGTWTSGLCSMFSPELVAAVPTTSAGSGSWSGLWPAAVLSLLAVGVAVLGERRAVAV